MYERFMKGIMNNPGIMMDSKDFRGVGGTIIYAPHYYGGCAVEAEGANKTIFDTGWIPPGIMRGNMKIVPFFMTVGIPTNLICFLGLVTRRDPETKKVIATTILKYRRPLVKTGSLTDFGNVNLYSPKFYTFDPQAEYRIEFKTQHMLHDARIILDYVYFEYIQRLQLSTPWIGATATHDEKVFMVEGGKFSIATDAHGNGEVRIHKLTLDDNTIVNKLFGVYDTIVSVTANLYGAGVNSTTELGTWWEHAADGRRGMDIILRVRGSAIVNGVASGSFQVIGNQIPTVI